MKNIDVNFTRIYNPFTIQAVMNTPEVLNAVGVDEVETDMDGIDYLVRFEDGAVYEITWGA